jgi:hypothetical protein
MTMKVVLNKCYGGFGVSLECLWALIQRGSKGVEVHDIPDYYGANNPNFADRWRESWEKDLAEMKAEKYRKRPDWLPGGWLASSLESTLYNVDEMKVYGYDRGNQYIEGSLVRSRCNPDLIDLIEKNGSEWASSDMGELRVVEIPDGIQWEIDEYDGIERIDEVHRSWG